LFLNGRLEGVRVLISVVMFAVLAFVATGCATTKPEDSDKWYQSQRQELRSKVEARWAALIKGETETAYMYLSPAQRSVVSLQQYRRTLGGAVQWRVAQVDDIRYDSPTVAVVSVALTYRFASSATGNKEIESVRQMQEKWLYKDGGWWYTTQ